MISPADIGDRARRKYRDYLRSIVEKTTFFPLDIAFAKAKPGEAAKRWSDLHSELEQLRRDSAENRPGKSYLVEWEERRDRLAGNQNLPARIYFPDERSYLAFIGKAKEAARFRTDATVIISAFPELAPWTAAKPLRVVEQAGDWDRILASLRWFEDNPASGLYLREVPAVEDTKFIERNKALIRELLDLVASSSVPVEDIDSQNSVERQSFEARCGLRAAAPLIRVRILDKTIAEARLSGIDDLAVPADRFASLGFDEIERVLVIENKASFGNTDVFLTAPSLKRTMAIFGSGYAAAALQAAPWLLGRHLFYWGDIDTHGLRILAAFRLNFPTVHSVMMDDATFERFPEYRSDAPPDSAPAPLGLTPDELKLFRRLASFSDQNRLEQERIPLAHVREMLAERMEESI
ncbi:MAG: hypothetical protein A2Y38_02000 [Spirochaetes bacterium GWB1_59_5]|nr:MAG: hypothetical protein A2Y38_02000 [Spirochaetes bacterium GWB1_59_5]